MVPFIEESVIPRRWYTRASESSTVAGRHVMREKAQQMGALTSQPGRVPASMSRMARPRCADGPGRHRRRHRRHRVWSVEPAHRPDGRRVDPADAGSPPMIDIGPCRSSSTRPRKSASRSSATWTPTCTSAAPARASRRLVCPSPILMDADESRRSRRRPCHHDAAVHQEDFDPQLEDALELFPRSSVTKRSVKLAIKRPSLR